MPRKSKRTAEELIILPEHWQKAADNMGLMHCFFKHCRIADALRDELYDPLLDALARAARDHKPERGKFSTMAMACMYRAWLCRLRAGFLKKNIPPLQIDPDLPDPAAPDDRRGKIDRVRLKVLKQALTPKQQELIKMRYDDRLNFVRIGQRLGIDSTVAWMRNKAAIRKMRAAAKERGWEIYGLLDR